MKRHSSSAQDSGDAVGVSAKERSRNNLGPRDNPEKPRTPTKGPDMFSLHRFWSESTPGKLGSRSNSRDGGAAAAAERSRLRSGSVLQGGEFADTVNVTETDTGVGNYKDISKDTVKETKNREEHYKTNSSYFDMKKFSIWKYMLTEIQGVNYAYAGEKQGLENLQTFFEVPRHVEMFIWLGCVLCFDAFIYVFTYLPLRCCHGVYLLYSDLCALCLPRVVISSFFPLFGLSARNSSSSSSGGGGHFRDSNAYDLLRGALFSIGLYVLQQCSMSWLYHYIRGTSGFKILTVLSMLELFDKMLINLGQDALDGLHVKLRVMQLSPSGVLSVLPTFLFASIYVILHCGIYFVYATALTVAINSDDDYALLWALGTTKFQGVKSAVLKKFDKKYLFAMSCSDVVERFQIVLYLILVIFVALLQAGEDWTAKVPGYLLSLCIMCGGACLCDCLKHAYVCKVSQIKASEYSSYRELFYNDILSYQVDKDKGVDRIYVITRRVGLCQIPLACLTVRYLHLARKTPWFQSFVAQCSLLQIVAIAALAFVCLLVFKALLGTAIFFFAGHMNNQLLARREREEREKEKEKEKEKEAETEKGRVDSEKEKGKLGGEPRL